jgi:heme-degrading monooxygenase HmoA
MVIGENVRIDAFARVYRLHVLPALRQAPGFRSAELLVEDGGKTIVSLTLWDSRDNCLRYHSGPAYRGFVEQAHHLLEGPLVVKLFEAL